MKRPFIIHWALVVSSLAALSGTGCGSSPEPGGSGGSMEPCGSWADWQCNPFSGGCNATCAADATRDVLCNPSGSCIFKTGATSNGSCQGGMSLPGGPGCGFCEAAVAAACY